MDGYEASGVADVVGGREGQVVEDVVREGNGVNDDADARVPKEQVVDHCPLLTKSSLIFDFRSLLQLGRLLEFSMANLEKHSTTANHDSRVVILVAFF